MEKYLSTKEAMQQLQLSYDGFNRLLLNGRIEPAGKVGVKNYFLREDIERIARTRTTKTLPL